MRPHERPSPDRQEVVNLRAKLARGDLEAVRRHLIEKLGPGGCDSADQPEAWAELCEEAGLAALAATCWERALEQDPGNRTALEGFVECCREEGMLERGIRVLEHLHTRTPDDSAVLAALAGMLRDGARYTRLEQLLAEAERRGASEELLGDLRCGAFDREEDLEHGPAASLVALPAHADLVRFLETFGGREDAHARQWHDPERGSGYSPVRQPLTLHLLRNHLLGNVTLGVYPVRRDGTVGFFAFDLDLDPAVVEARRSDGAGLVALREELEHEVAALHDRLVEHGLDPLVEDSGYKGRHLWVLASEPIDAGLARRAGLALAQGFPVSSAHVRLEVFPKQARVRSGGLGNLIKLPLGIHRRTGRRSRLLDARGHAIDEPWQRLREAGRARRADLERIVENLGGAIVELRAGTGGNRSARRKGTDGAAGPAPSETIWTSGHLLADVELRTVLEGCRTIGDLARRALRGERLSYGERVVVRHTLGHLHNGAPAVNYLFERAGPLTDELVMGARLRCAPMSCRRIRERLGIADDAGGCTCTFPFAPDTYAHPLLFLRRLAAERLPSPAEREPDSTYMIAEALARLRTSDRQVLPLPDERLESEREMLERRLVRRLEALGDRTIRTPAGTHALVDEGGLTRLRFVPADGADTAATEAGGRA